LSKFSKVPLGKAALSIIDGDRGANYPKKTEFFSKGDCWFLNTSNVKSAGFDFGEMDFITAEKDAALSKGKLRRHDIVLTTRGTIGNCAYFGEDIPFEDIRINSGMVVLRADPSQLDPYFLYAFLRSEIFKIQTGTHSSGSAQPQLPIGALRNIVIPLFELQHQRKIAAVLSALDAKIALNHRINVELEGMAKLLYDYWFVQYDFPLSAAQAAALGKPRLIGQPYRSSGGPMVFDPQLKREIPKGWKVGNLLDIATFTNGIACQKFPPTSDEHLRVIKIKEMHSGFTETSEKVTTDVPEKVIVRDGDILFSWSASLEVMIWTGGKGALNQHIFKVTSDNYPKSICYFTLQGYLQHFKMMADQRKTTMGHITREHLEQSRIAIPPKEIGNEFESITEPIFAQIISNHKQNQELTTLRDWLLPMLMNGQVRVG